MNKVTIIGNLSSDPVTRETSSGSVTSFSVAVNRRGKDQKADFFRVSAWRQLGENCQKYLKKGRKVAVVGSVSASVYMVSSGEPRASLDISADEVEFLSQKQEAQEDKSGGFVEVEDEKLPF